MKQANTNYVSVIIAVLAAVGLLGFCIGVAHACIVSWCPCNNDLTSFSKYEGFALKTIAGILATHLGAVLGIKVVSAGSSGLRDIVSDPMHDAFNVAACIIYLLALIVTVWIFQRHHF